MENTTMTVEQVRAAKRQAEADVAEVLQRFMDTTGMKLEDVRFHCFVEHACAGDLERRRTLACVEIVARL